MQGNSFEKEVDKLPDELYNLTYKKWGINLELGWGIILELDSMIESACKWLIQQRFKCVGMRWSEDGFNNLLHLRLAWVNGSFDDLFG